VQTVAARAIREETAQGCSNHLLRGALRVVARYRAVHDTATAVLRCTHRTLARTAGALPLERLDARTADFAAILGLMGALTRSSELSGDHLMDQRDIGLSAEKRRGQFNTADLLALRVGDVERPDLELGSGSHELRPLHCVANEYETATTTGNSALDEQQSLPGVDCLDDKVLHGHTVIAHAAGHLLALEHATRSRGAADRAWLTVVAVCTVRGGCTGEVVTLHNASKTLTLRCTDDVDLLTDFESSFEGELLPKRVLSGISSAYLGEVTTRGDTGLLKVTGRGLVHLARIDLTCGDLHGAVAVDLCGADLGDNVGCHLNNGDGNDIAVLVPNLGHTE